jgi:hypothetical protein
MSIPLKSGDNVLDVYLLLVFNINYVAASFKRSVVLVMKSFTSVENKKRREKGGGGIFSLPP